MMKKSFLTISMVALLGAVWTGASWYTGKIIEEKMPVLTDNMNYKISSYLPQQDIKFTYDDYHRGIFSSQVRYVLQLNQDNTSAKIIFIETIDHGPFPISQIKKGNLLPIMASVHSTLENTPILEKIFIANQGKSLLSADSRVSYLGHHTSVIQFSPINYEYQDTRLIFSGGTMTAYLSNDMNNADFTAQSDAFTFITQNDLKQTETLNLKSLTLRSVNHMGKFGVFLGEAKIAFKEIHSNVNDKNNINLNGIQFYHKTNELDHALNTELNYSLDDLNIDGNDFGSGKLFVSLEGIDGQTIKHFMEIIKNKTSKSLEAENHDEFLNTDQKDITKNIWQAALKGNAILKIEPLSWKNSQGEGTFNLQAQMKMPESTTTDPQNLSLASGIKKIDARLNIPVVMLKELMTQISILQGNSQEESQKLADQKVHSVAKLGKLLKFTTLENDIIGSQFYFENHQIDLNGQKFSSQSFSKLFNIAGLLNAKKQKTPEIPSIIIPSNS
ncbi:YdgA family protein [Candidatus Williamhamiltonella defendens]|uniref:YdgA family protein n=1 Tax=Candidatus Williamhamiltonella defendens TaxID=138072 RepID=UPI00130EDDB3|nr:YdgA family protein [Candidatus Hamiltonella defensa]